MSAVLASVRIEFPTDDILFPFSVPSISSMRDSQLEFPTPVTILVGENGSGKSTLIESLAWATELPVVGSEESSTDETLAHARLLGKAMRLQWSTKRTRSGFFLRAEDFFGFAKRIDSMRVELESDLAAVDADPTLSDRSRMFARMPFASQIGALQKSYGKGVDTRSHGEQFLELFAARLGPGGLFLLDEPEAPLSPTRQLTLISMIRQRVQEGGCQFVIATHSPLLMAIPEATIYTFDNGTIEPAAYDTLDHVTITRDFLNDPALFMRHLK